MTWGEHIEKLENLIAPQLAARGQKLSLLDNRPKLKPSVIWVWDAYASLERDRSHTQGGPGPIPFSAIDTYARRYGIDEIGMFDVFRQHIMALDRVFLEHVRQKLDEELKKHKRGRR